MCSRRSSRLVSSLSITSRGSRVLGRKQDIGKVLLAKEMKMKDKRIEELTAEVEVTRHIITDCVCI